MILHSQRSILVVCIKMLLSLKCDLSFRDNILFAVILSTATARMNANVC